ncbi:non-specific serine/threonine protein kinase [Prosthecobacter debontii]|uniref:Non-specific serine/threonine protein kinase n=1 Tax=Prosthecobacter debontii TaxID=48467 RepID=A0A1T4XYD4_9BACT|nr:serine/threonine-protein kinase [Prosthecobacter debontii]SKA94403.1 non-specific serine/threonine protein kinase [Prosthecobacter debontii]
MSDLRPNKLTDVESLAGFFDIALADELPEEVSAQETAGMIIAGRYLLKSLLGGGGAGNVWLAEQTQPVRREVAVKIIRPGLGTGVLSGRFIREYQVLARLEHPNIAGVFDAGELPDGRTYFVMEMVAGDAITTWCRQQETPLRARLEIFAQACFAVQHAHQKGILHRDLKPSNVMVTLLDGKPVVKIIDFGIAKALAGDLPPTLDMTLNGVVLGTPRYMSPEQAGLTGQDVDTRTDVYALGVLLYELLTGTTPIQVADEKNAPLPDLLQQVRQTEIELPSRRVARLDSTHLFRAKELRGELDWIVLKALQKDREQRYAPALTLAEEIHRYLRDEPVLAGPPGTGYQVKKWLTRHRSTALSAAAVLGALSAGVATTWWALERMEQQRLETQRLRLAEQNQAELAEQVSAQLGELLASARKHVEAGMNTQALRRLADECAASLSRFRNQPRTEQRLVEQLALLYTALQEPGRSLPWFQRQWELTAQLEGENSEAALLSLYNIAWRATAQNQAERAVPMLKQVLAGFEKLPGGLEARPVRSLSVRRELARALSRTGHHEEAITLMASVVRQKNFVRPDEAALWLRDQAEMLRLGGRPTESATALRQSLALIPDDAAHSSLRAYVLASLATTTSQPADHESALAASLARLKHLETEVGARDPRLLNALLNHAVLACKVPGCPGGEEAARRALNIAQSAGHESLLADAWIMVSETLRVQRRIPESEDAIRQGLAEAGPVQTEPWRELEMHRRLGDLLAARRNFEEAWEEYQIAFKDWLTHPAAGRPPEKERLIFTSIIAFWEKLAKVGSPMADPTQLEVWRARLREWECRRAPAHVMN